MPADTGHATFPRNVPLDQDNFNRWVTTAIDNLRAQLIPPSLVSNLRATPQPGGNLVEFTRSDGDSYTLYINTTPSIDLAVRVRLGPSNQYSHNVGIGSVKYYYAVRANKGSLAGEVSGWVSGTTLALGTPATAAAAIPATQFPFVDQETASVQIAIPAGNDYQTV